MGGQDDEEGALLLAGDELSKYGLDHLGVVQELVKVVQQQDGRAVLFRQGGQGPQRGQRVAGRLVLACVSVARQAQAGGDVPGGQRPALSAAVLDDLALGLVGLTCLDPHPSEGGVDVLGELLGQGHLGPFWVSGNE
jgi:hypothetical protein